MISWNFKRSISVNNLPQAIFILNLSPPDPDNIDVSFFACIADYHIDDEYHGRIFQIAIEILFRLHNKRVQPEIAFLYDLLKESVDYQKEQFLIESKRDSIPYIELPYPPIEKAYADIVQQIINQYPEYE